MIGFLIISIFIGSLLLMFLSYAIAWFWKKYYCVRFIDGIPIFQKDPNASIPFLDDSDTYYPRAVLSLVEWLGPIFQFECKDQLIVFVNDGKIAKFVLDEILGKGSVDKGRKSIFGYENISTFNTNSKWLMRRKALKPCCSMDYLQAYSQTLEDCLLSLKDCLSATATEKTPIKMVNIFGRFVLDVILRVQFQKFSNYLQDIEKYEELHKSFEDYEKYHKGLKQLSKWKHYYTYLNAKKVLYAFADELIQHVEAKYYASDAATVDPQTRNINVVHDCFGVSLIQLAKDNGFTREQIQSELLNFILAAKKPLEASLSWLVYSLANYSVERMKCENVLNGLIQNDELSLVNPFYSLPNYLEGFLRETLRKFPPVHQLVRLVRNSQHMEIPMDRKDLILNNEMQSIILPSNTRVIVNIYTLQNSSQNWGPNAHMFYPDRWLRQPYASEEKSLNEQGIIGGNKIYDGYGNSMDDLLFAPFSSGVRHCMGTPMALWIMRSVFFMILQNFQFQFVNSDKFHDEYQVLTMHNHILLPADELPVMVSMKQ